MKKIKFYFWKCHGGYGFWESWTRFFTKSLAYTIQKWSLPKAWLNFERSSFIKYVKYLAKNEEKSCLTFPKINPLMRAKYHHNRALCHRYSLLRSYGFWIREAYLRIPFFWCFYAWKIKTPQIISLSSSIFQMIGREKIFSDKGFYKN